MEPVSVSIMAAEETVNIEESYKTLNPVRDHLTLYPYKNLQCVVSDYQSAQ